MKNGRRPIKLVLHEIHESNESWNENGITWLREPVEKNLPSIVGASITAEFIDSERTEILGHGETGIEDGLPTFENASMLGVFEKYSIEQRNIDGEEKHFACAEGYLDELRYKNFVKKLEYEINNGNTPFGSTEILGLPENDNKIIYKDGWVPQGRIPTDFLYSGWSFLSIRPADSNAVVLELNNKIEIENKNESEENNDMDEKILNGFVNDIKDSVKLTISETNSKNLEYETKITELNEKISEVNASSEEVQKALDEARAELDTKYKELDAAYEEIKTLQDELGKAKAKERVGELNSALADFTDDEKAFASDEIKAFEENPLVSEINSIIAKISTEIVKKAKEAKKVSEINSVSKPNEPVEDIFSDIYETNSYAEDDNIF